jgi:hypothetical protein
VPDDYNAERDQATMPYVCREYRVRDVSGRLVGDYPHGAVGRIEESAFAVESPRVRQWVEATQGLHG